MVLQFDMTAADYRVAQQFATRGLPTRGRPGRGLLSNLLLWVAITVALTVVFQSTGLHLGDWLTREFVHGAVATMILLVCFALFAMHRMRARQLRSLMPFPIPHTFQLHPDGLGVSSRFGEGRFAWVGFLGIEQLPAHIGLLFRPGSAMVIRNDAFASQQAREDFVALVRSHLQAAD